MTTRADNQHRFLDPAVLAGISQLDLVAKTVVDGFIAGLHRSPDFGFSQEFAEYRAYTPGDDLRHIDWNVFARTERAYLKRYRGETNTQLTILLDASRSMEFSSHAVSKLDYARFLASSLAYMANQQRDAAGLAVFHEEVVNYVPASTRHGQFPRLVHAIASAETGTRTNFSAPFLRLQQMLHRRGILVVISDFYEDPEAAVRVMEPLLFRGNELVLFHVLDPEEIRPDVREPVLLVDMESDAAVEVSPEYVNDEYRQKIGDHIARLRTAATRSGMDYFLLETNRPLDAALREYLAIRQGRN